MKVLFVCSANSFRSPIAEALLRKYKPEVEVDSAAAKRPTVISKYIRKSLAREKALKYLKHTAESIDQTDLRKYNLIIVMEPEHRDIVLSKCPECAGKVMFWKIDDARSFRQEDVDVVFDKIKKKVKELADSL